MKITLIGSGHLNNCLDSLGDSFNSRKEVFSTAGGISIFLKNNKNLDFYDNILNSDIVFIDILSDIDAIDSNYNLIINEYQRLVWYIFSINPNLDIHVVNFLRYEINNIDSLLGIISGLKLKNCEVHSLGKSDLFEKRDEYVQDMFLDLLGEGLNLNNKKKDDSGLQKVIANLKSKKEFETKY